MENPSNSKNMILKDIVMLVDTKISLVTIVKHARVLEMAIKKKLLDVIRKMDLLKIRTGSVLITRNKDFGCPERNDKLSSIG